MLNEKSTLITVFQSGLLKNIWKPPKTQPWQLPFCVLHRVYDIMNKVACMAEESITFQFIIHKELHIWLYPGEHKFERKRLLLLHTFWQKNHVKLAHKNIFTFQGQTKHCLVPPLPSFHGKAILVHIPLIFGEEGVAYIKRILWYLWMKCMTFD